MRSRQPGKVTRNRYGQLKREIPLHIMLIPALILVFIFKYIPMFGIIISFQNFKPTLGFSRSEFVGLDNYRYIFNLPSFKNVMRNTITIAMMKIVAGLVVPIFFALLLNEVRNNIFKRTVQTVIYFPHFLSWVILGGIFIDVLSPTSGIINRIIVALGGDSIYFMGNKQWFPFTLVLTETWKSFGYGTIIYLAALTSIDETLYEAAVVDGATRLQQTRHITLPGISSIVMLMTILSLGSILDAGFDQVFNLYSPQVYETGDILDTLIYRIGMEEAQFSVSTAIGLFKSLVSLVLIASSNYMANRFAGYRVF